jgi:hypothetical protein
MQKLSAAQNSRQHNRGISLMETCMAGTVLSVLLSQAIPAM